MTRLYHYVGPEEIARRCESSPGGHLIESATDVITWMGGRSGIATFVIDEHGQLLIADRHSEHVACAQGRPVRSAGEMAFVVEDGSLTVEWVTNQSTGYCPSPDSWPAVRDVLLRLGIAAPTDFSPRFIFRRCARCLSINIVKENVFECAVCSADLSVSR